MRIRRSARRLEPRSSRAATNTGWRSVCAEPLGAGGRNLSIPPEHPTLPSLLKKAGYSTTLIGKWHLGWLPVSSPLKVGYDHF